MSSEFALIRRHFVRSTPGAVLGPGDDCAIVAPTPGCELCVTTDMLAEGTHFFSNTDPWRLGWKTLAVNLSDLAAMGATPRWALLAGCLPHGDEKWLSAFARGFFALAEEFNVDLIGGDTTRGSRNFCVTAIGEVPAGTAIRRDCARLGDDLWVSGGPGFAALGLASQRGLVKLPTEITSACLDALEKPQPRLALGCALRGVASSAIDVSDGLLGDLRHILEQSNLAAQVNIKGLPPLPPGVETATARRAQLTGGDDYELVFSAPSTQRLNIEHIATRVGVQVARFGSCIAPASGKPLIDMRWQGCDAIEIDAMGFDHFLPL